MLQEQASHDTLVDGHRRGRVPRAVRRRQLLDIADRLFAERGFHGASMEEIARQSGVSKPIIYDHFGSKEQLFAACVHRAGEQLADRVTAAASGAGNPRELLKAGSLAYFGFIGEQLQSWAVLFVGADDVRDARIAAESSLIRNRQADLMIGIMAEMFQITPEHSGWEQLEAMTVALAGAYESLSRWWYEHPDVSVEQLVDWVVEMVYPGMERVMTELLSRS